MKRLFFVAILFLFSCSHTKEKSVAIVLKTDEKEPEVAQPEVNNWQQGFGLSHDIDEDSIWHKPVRYYIENPDCDTVAKAFYFGTYRPADERKTAAILTLATSNNSTLRPFYRWILSKTISVQDGALAEYTGVPARKYAEKFPTEFFDYVDFDKTGEEYESWYNSILYSGFYETDDYKVPEKIRGNFERKMKENCVNCDAEMKRKIEKFAYDCFPDYVQD